MKKQCIWVQIVLMHSNLKNQSLVIYEVYNSFHSNSIFNKNIYLHKKDKIFEE